MRAHMALLCAAIAALGLAGCKKNTGGGGGGGGSWLVGSSGLITHVDPQGDQSATYDLGSSQNLNGIACRFAGEAWVVGAGGTLLYTDNGGNAWSARELPTTADLRAIATQDSGPVFVGGDGTFLVTNDTGANWTELADGQAHFLSIAAAQAGDTVLALSDDGGIWAYDGHALVREAEVPGARAVAVSPDGLLAIAAGHGLSRSDDGGATWNVIPTDPALEFDAVRLQEDGSALAVGSGGTIARIDPSGTVDVQHAGAADLHAVQLEDADTSDGLGYAAGDGGAVLITHDGGRTWTAGPNLGRTVRGMDDIGFGHH